MIALIVTLAARYSPTMLNFVLVDFKGGGAFAEFRTLPHCVDIVTNLTGDAVTRMFTAIRAELDRRSALNTRAKVKTIVEYQQRGLHNDPAFGPYPFLFIIIDEFAEMIADHAEYKAQLETITRIGRSLGVHLLLAAQRPQGVTDQMRANIKYRIALRVQDAAESREMLRRTEAAYLPSNIPGRGYLQVGNEEIELIQVAYAGDPYTAPGDARPRVRWPDRTPPDTLPPALYQQMITRLAQLACDEAVPAQRAPWPGPLPATLTLTEVLNAPRLDPQTRALPLAEQRWLPAISDTGYLREVALLTAEPESKDLLLSPALHRWRDLRTGWDTLFAAHGLEPVIGLADDPQHASHYPLTISLDRGHTVLYGGPGSGKTTSLRTLLVCLAANYAPDSVHLFALDLGGSSLMALANLPHVGAIISPTEPSYRERIDQLLRMLDDAITHRKGLFGATRSETLPAYNRGVPEDPQPALVVVIDNFVEFVETFGTQPDGAESGLERLITIARQGRQYGVHLVVTAGQPSQVPNQLATLLTERLALRLVDTALYRDALGISLDDVGQVPGRGYALVTGRALRVQVATVGEQQVIDDLIAAQLAVVADWPLARRRRLPTPLVALPPSVLLRTLLARRSAETLTDAAFLTGLEIDVAARWAASREPGRADWLHTLIGVAGSNIPRTLHLAATQDGVHGMIAGGTGAGKSELLMTMLVSLALDYDPSVLNFVLVDYKGGGAFAPFASLPHVVDLVTNLNKSAVRRMFTAIGAEMDRRARVLKDVAKDVVEYRAKGLHRDPAGAGPLPHLFIIIDEFVELITDSTEFRDELDRIARIGRSLGVNLLLAAQQPVGVSDQMRANIKLRICLRVESIDTSRELLRRSDAAFLPSGQPGRGYIQVGSDAIELVQVAYTGEPVADAPPTERGEPPRFYELAVRLSNTLLAQQAAARPAAPWPPPLPVRLPFDPLDVTALSVEDQGVYLRRQHDGLPLVPQLGAWLAGAGDWPQLHWTHDALRPVIGLLDDPITAQQRPLVLDLSRGHAVVFGTSGSGKTTLLRALVLSLAATHPPGALHIHILDLGGRTLALLDTLPHVGTVIMPDDGGYEERVQLLWRKLFDTLDARKRQISAAGAQDLHEYNARHPDAPLPAIVVLIDNIAEFLDSFGKHVDQDDNPLAQLITLARQGKTVGLHLVVTANRLNVLSSKLYSLFTERLALRLADTDEYPAIVGTRIDAIDDIAGRGVAPFDRRALLFQIAVLPPLQDADRVLTESEKITQLATAMRAAHTARGRPGGPPRLGALPQNTMFPEVLARDAEISFDKATFPDLLRVAVASNWQQHRRAEASDWLRVPIGIASGDQICAITFDAQKDGVHGMVAGSTGSGKSELLTTLIVGLALRYPPDILNFVLVDYKGGGAFRPFETLPHCVEIVTNLDKTAVNRMFTAISAEIRRRQARNMATQTKDIVEYRTKGLHLSEESYPHLFIIIDEYVEMIEDNQEYRAQLESITRVGRAQGVHLLLASQRPKGVSDQMRANIKLRLCLRVEDAEASRELLRRPDAARLPSGLPGRGYLQGGGETVELVQVAYSGESMPNQPATLRGEPPRFYEFAVDLARELHAGALVRRPWPLPLPIAVSLTTPLPDWENQSAPPQPLVPILVAWLDASRSNWPAADWRYTRMSAIVGLVDDPEEARQRSYVLDLYAGHMALFGDGGSGKTTVLRTIVTGLAASYPPDQLHVYAVDFGGRGFAALAGFPHIGALLSSDEESFDERLRRLLDRLTRTADTRQQMVTEAGANTFAEYNAQHAEHPIPTIVLLIDNIAGFGETYEALIESTFIPLVRRALGVGICVIVTGNAPNSMAGKLYGLIAQRLTLRQANPDRYADIVGRGALEIGETPGRGYVRANQRALLFHAAQPVDTITTGQSEADVLGRLGQQFRAAFGERPGGPLPIEILQRVYPLDVLLDKFPPDRAQVLPVLGQRGDLEPALLDLQRAPHFVVAGPPLSGKTTALRTIMLSLAARYDPAQVGMILVDLQRRLFAYGGAYGLDYLPHVQLVVSEPEEFATLVTHLQRTCERLEAERRHVFVFIDNFDEFSEEIERTKTRPSAEELARLVRRYGSLGLHLVIATGGETSTTSDLRRRVQAAGYGLGLRTAQALQVLKASRTPAGLEGRELPVGRGYIVRNGQTTLVQVATPASMRGSTLASADTSDEIPMLTALDAWVLRLTDGAPIARGSTAVATAHPPLPPLDTRSRWILAVIEAAAASLDADSPLRAQIVGLTPEEQRERSQLAPLLDQIFVVLKPELRGIITDEENQLRNLAEKFAVREPK